MRPLRRAFRAVLRFGLQRYRGHEVRPIIFCAPGDVVGDDIIFDGYYERELLEAIFNRLLAKETSNFKTKCCLDVGANLANHSIYFSSRFQHVYGFEPNPVFYEVANASISINNISNITLFPIGLSDRAQVLPYHLDRKNLGASYFDSDVAGTVRLGEDLRLPLTTGDEIVSSRGIQNVGLIKIDVEGFEGRVIDGLKDVIIKDNPYILFESHPELDLGVALKVFSRLRELGYKNFYTADNDRRKSDNFISRAVRLYLKGSKNNPREIQNPEKQVYLIVVASKEPLL